MQVQIRGEPTRPNHESALECLIRKRIEVNGMDYIRPSRTNWPMPRVRTYLEAARCTTSPDYPPNVSQAQ